MDGSLRSWFAITYGIAGARRSRYARAAAQCRAQSVIGSPAADAQVAADMDGIKALPTSHSIRAYLAVLYRL
jgi:hypothetical protein